MAVIEAGPDRSDPVIRSLTDDAAVLPIGPDSPVARRYRSALTGTESADVVRGSVLGGSGAVNGGYFCRALPTDFDDAPLGWSWIDVEPHYRAVETLVAARPQHDFAPATAAFAAAAGDAGFRWLPDLNTAGGPGVGAVPLNIAGGIRRGPGAVFLEPALARPNLTVLTETRATGLVISGGRVRGVAARGPHGAISVSADRVVLAAGAVESAHLLMLSGIGPACPLRALGVTVVADLPVGQSTQDHPEWVATTGWPGAAGHPVLEAVLLDGELEIRPYTTGFGSEVTTIGIALMRPRSRGRVTLVSADPSVPPQIEHRYDSEPADTAELRRGWELVAEILDGATALGAPARSTSQHLCGTAPMGTGEQSVVDSRCRVHGVGGLSVIDGSVLPRIPGRGPHATIAMLAHRAAEFLRS